VTTTALDQLHRLEIGGGAVEAASGGATRLTLPPKPSGYADAQLDDTASLPRSRFLWQPPLHLRLRARASHTAPLGTLGFGFWNDPFAVSLGQGGAARRLPTAPRALWFFYASPPADMRFTPRVGGHGWKAMQLTTRPMPTAALVTLAPAAVVLSQLPPLRGPVLRRALGRVQAAEAMLSVDLTDWHTYEIDWQAGQTEFRLDGQVVLRAPFPLAGPLGFVAWIDNQFATATVESGFRFGLVPLTEHEWLEIEAFEIAGARGV
jgi:hypothetical protein